MYFKKWLILSEAKEDKELALQLVNNDKNIIDRINSIVPQGRKDTDQLTLLAAYYFSQHKNIEELLREFRAYLGYFNNNRMQLYPVDHTTKKPETPWDSYIHWTQVIHGLQGEDVHKLATKQQVTDLDFQNEKPIETSTDGKIKVYKANSPQQCIILGKGKTFCISQPGNRMWQRYRDTKTSTFYFVFDEDPPHDRLGIVVVDKQPYRFELTDKVNRTGNTIDPITGQETTNPQSYINYLKNKGINISLFENIEKSEAEIAEDEKLGRQNNDLSWFQGLSFDEKSKYIGRGHPLSDEQFDYLIASNLKSLLEQYVKTGLQINKHQIDIIKNKKDLKDYYIHNRLLNLAGQFDYLSDYEYEILNDIQKEKLFENIDEITKAHRAIHYGRHDILVKINPKLLREDAYTLLRSACSYGNVDDVRYIVNEIGAKPNESCLELATENGHLDIVKYYLEELKLMSPKYLTHLTHNIIDNACKYGHLDIVKYLIEIQGLKVGDHSVHTACIGGNLNLIKYLIEKENARIGPFSMQTASGYGYLDIVDYLFSKTDADINESLSSAAFNGHLNIVKYLVEKKVPIKPEALNSAAKNGHFDIVKYLVENGSQIEYMAVEFALEGNYVNILKYLIEKGAKISDKNQYAKYAASHGYFDAFKYLVEKKEEKGEEIKELLIDSLYSAIDNNYFNIIKYLVDDKKIKYLDNFFMDRLVGSSDRKIDIIKYFIEKGGYRTSNVTVRNAISNGYDDAAVLLVNNGAEIGDAILAAIGKKNFNMIKFLIEKGADINSYNLDNIYMNPKIREYLNQQIEKRNQSNTPHTP